MLILLYRGTWLYSNSLIKRSYRDENSYLLFTAMQRIAFWLYLCYWLDLNSVNTHVKYNFFSASGYVLNKYFSIYFCGWFGSSFSRIFLFQKSRKKPVLNRGLCATGADGSRVSTFVTLLFSSSGGWNTSEQFANHHQYLLIWLQLAGGGHSNNSPAGTKPLTVKRKFFFATEYIFNFDF